MNHMFTNVQYAKAKCVRFIARQISILKGQGFTAQIQNKTDTPSDLRLYLTYLTARVHSGLERPKRSTRTAQRLVRGVALVIGITLFLPVQQVSNAQFVPIQSAKQYAKSQVSGKEYSCLSKLWGKESAWNHKADNPHSTAFGIPQILGMKETNPIKQVDLGLKYIKHRYDNPCKAWKQWKRNGGWY